VETHLTGNKLFNQIQGINELTFFYGQRTYQRDKNGNIDSIVVEYTFPQVPVPNPFRRNTFHLNFVGIEVRKGVANPTRTNTLLLDPDCNTVRNSFPGQP
jgi:hypothetical protein